jgi:hypothetical protein
MTLHVGAASSMSRPLSSDPLRVQSVVRMGRRVGVGTGTSVAALAGAGFGLYLGFLLFIITWGLGGDTGFYIGFFVVAPACVLGGALLGAWLFLRFRVFANGLRSRHPRVGALTWVLGCTILVLLAANAVAAASVVLEDWW